MATETELPAGKPFNDLSSHSQWAAHCLRQNIADIQNKIPALPNDLSANKLAPIEISLYEGVDEDPSFKIGIIGAGIAGLFTAMLFDHLKEVYGLDVEYEILEAKGENRVGGRLFTYEFPNNSGHDYYDVGAMRFPNNKVMESKLDMKAVNPEAKPKVTPKKGDLIRYYMDGTNTPLCYNGHQKVFNPIDKDAPKPKASDFCITGLPEFVTAANPGKLVSDQVEPFVKEYDKNPKKFWKDLTENFDKYSTRQYLTQVAGYDYNTIEWLETANFGNRWYDQAFSEMVLEEIDFRTVKQKDWLCVEGGAQQIAHRAAESLRQKDKIRFGKAVTQIDYVRDELRKPKKVDVTVLGEETSRRYDAVFNSAPLGAMQHMRLEGLNLNWGTKQAIRSLGYGASCKVGIRFKKMWWMEKPYLITRGGVSKTDMPLRCCVYPSYNIDDKPEDGGVLLVSYTWSQEADRIGALIKRESPGNESALKDVLLHDLARLHTNDDTGYKSLLEKLYRLYDSHYAHDWYADEHQVGAFAFFGPDQFKNLYHYVTRTDGKHIIIGEAASAHHAWVVGALESAVRGVYQFAYRHSKRSKKLHEIARDYANQDDASRAPDSKHDDGPWKRLPMPFGPLPYEFDRTKDLEYSLEIEAGAQAQASTQPQASGDARVRAEVEKVTEVPNITKVQASGDARVRAEVEKRTEVPKITKVQANTEVQASTPAQADREAYAPNGDIARQGVLMELIRQMQGGDMVDGTKITKQEIKPILRAVAEVKNLVEVAA